MLNVLATTVPVFLIMALGYAAVRFGLFTKAEIAPMGRLVINVTLPALLFLSLAGQPLATIANPEYLLAYGLGSLVVLAGGYLLFRLRGRDAPGSAIPALGMAASNSAFVGLPVALHFFGPIASVAVALSMMVENFLVFPLVFAAAEEGSGGDRGLAARLGARLLPVVRNPLPIAIVAGTLASLLQVELPEPLMRSLDMLARASTSLALFVVGGTLVGLRVGGMISDVSIVTLGKLILHPLAVAACVFLFLPGDPLGPVAILLAAAPIFSIYAIIGQRYGLGESAAAALFVATAASFVTLNLLLWLL